MKRSTRKHYDLRLDGLRFLVIDEDVWTGRSLAIFGQSHGATVDLATSGEAARAALADDPLPYDVVLAGSGAANIAMEDVMADLRRRAAHIPVVIHASSAVSSDSFALCGFRLEGSADIRPVPATLRTVFRAALEAIRGGYTVRRSLATRTIRPSFPVAQIPAACRSPDYGRVVVSFAASGAVVRSPQPGFSQRGTRP